MSQDLICTKSFVGWGFAPDPTGGACSAPPDPLAGFKGPTSKGREGRERKGSGNRKGERGRKGEGGEEERGKEGRGDRDGRESLGGQGDGKGTG